MSGPFRGGPPGPHFTSESALAWRRLVLAWVASDPERLTFWGVGENQKALKRMRSFQRVQAMYERGELTGEGAVVGLTGAYRRLVVSRRPRRSRRKEGPVGVKQEERHELTVEEAVEKLASLRSYSTFARTRWEIPDKGGRYVPLVLNAAQRLVDSVYEGQMKLRGYVRMNVLKARQSGISTYSRTRATHYLWSRTNRTALSIAHSQQLPAQWLLACRDLHARTDERSRPASESAQGNELRWSARRRYYIASAQGGFPGLGDTIHFLHVSELGRWDKTPISVDPAAVLGPLAPSIPTGRFAADTVVIRESTGLMVGDYWNLMWELAGRGQDEFQNVFIPWFMVQDYRSEAHVAEVLAVSPSEARLVAHAKAKYGLDVDKAMLAWRRRNMRASPFCGNEELWSCEYPAYEEEAFRAGGQSIWTLDQRRAAARTVRPPIWTGHIQPDLADPRRFGLWTQTGESATPGHWGQGRPAEGARASFDGAGGTMSVWQWPTPGGQYVLGADCQWSGAATSDFDCLHVVCLQTRKVVAKVRGRYDLAAWGRVIASVGWLYNAATVAPERNSKAADVVLPLLLGQVAGWRYPNVYIRLADKLGQLTAKDFGWLTDRHTKGMLIQLAMQRTNLGQMDWCDAIAVEQMATCVQRPDGGIGAVEGANDDDLMSRLITEYVAASSGFKAEPVVQVWHPQTPAQRLIAERTEELDRLEREEQEREADALDAVDVAMVMV